MSIFFEVFADPLLQFWISGFMFDARNNPLPILLGALAGFVVAVFILMVMFALLVAAALVRAQRDKITHFYAFR